MAKSKCMLCGKVFNNSHGMMVHKYHCQQKNSSGVPEAGGGKKPAKTSKKGASKKQRVQPASPVNTTGQVVVTVPCDFGGNKFNAQLTLQCAGTVFLPA